MRALHGLNHGVFQQVQGKPRQDSLNMRKLGGGSYLKALCILKTSHTSKPCPVEELNARHEAAGTPINSRNRQRTEDPGCVPMPCYTDAACALPA